MNNITVYKVTTTTCGNCKMVQPHWEKVKKAMPEIEFVEVVADKSDEDMEFARNYGVIQLPTFIVLENGKETKRKWGFMSEKQLTDFLKS